MARRRPPTVHGVCIVDKPAGITSHDVVGQLRKRFSERQIGHAGTLDPDATGVLVVAVGMATRLLQFATASTKTYIGEVVLGAETSTLDAAGEVVATYDMSSVTLADVHRVVKEHLLGEIDQIPPMVSALKVDGKRLHELAREGIEIERKPRRVTISRCDVRATSEPNVFAIEVECSAGTYIRSIADDIGHLLGGGAHLRALRRVASGPFGVDRAAPPDTCELLPVETIAEGLRRVDVSEEIAQKVSVGGLLPMWDGEGPWALYTDDVVIAVYEAFRDGDAKPTVVLPTASQR